MMKYSFVIPVFNEEDSLPVLKKEIEKVTEPLGEDYEVIFVNDCSNDSSLNILQRFQKQNQDKFKIIDLKQRSGQTFAMRKGLDAAQGSFVFTLDADLQNDPHDIPKLLAEMEKGYDCVCGWRKSREDTWLKARLSKLGNAFQRLISGLKIHDVSCTLRVFKKNVIAKIALNWEGQHRFIPLSLALQGYKIGEIVSNHRRRVYGKTKYSHKRIFRVVGDFFRILIAKGRA